jgi:hypothetical protein
MQRDRRVDSIRGVLLIVMTVDHIGGPLATFTDQPLGFVSALSGFVLISGYLFSQVYGQLIAVPRKLWWKSAMRAWSIFRYHIALIVFALLLLRISPAHANELRELMRPLTADFSNGYYLWMTVTLVHQPVIMDILPMYAGFVLLSPCLVLALKQGYGGLVVAASLALWLLGRHVNPTQLLSAALCDGCRYGYLNLFAWQLVWVGGILMGWWSTSKRWQALVRNPWTIGSVTLAAFYLFLVRHAIIDAPIAMSTDLNSLGMLRVVNLLVVIALVLAILVHVPRTTGIPWVSWIGRYSLQVFAFHVLLAYALAPYISDIELKSGLGGYMVVMSAVVASLSVPALVQQWRVSRSRGASAGAVP